MWIVILNFCIFLLLIGFMFYGFSKWTKLITEYEDGSEEVQNDKEDDQDKKDNLVDERYYRLPLWILFLGLGISQVIGFIKYLFGY